MSLLKIVPGDACADILNNAFAKAFPIVANNSNSFFQSPNFIQMFSILIDPADIIKTIDSVKVSSSTGIDGMNSKFLKDTKMYQSINLAKLFHRSLAQSNLPDDWKVGKVVLLHKGGVKHSPNNLRPFSLTSVHATFLNISFILILPVYLNQMPSLPHVNIFFGSHFPAKRNFCFSRTIYMPFWTVGCRRIAYS